MRKPRFIQINIPTPCHQSWDEMTPEGQGRHCTHCQKTVIDFTTWSDTTLYNFFSKDNGRVCGRFLSTQVDRPINIPYQPHSRLYRYTIALGFTLMFTQTPQLLAQNRPPLVEYNIASNADIYAGEIVGSVVDETKEPVIGVNVEVFQKGVLKGRVVTDYDGRYVIRPLDGGVYDLVVYHPGHDTAQVVGLIVTGGQRTILNFTIAKVGGNKNPGKTVTKYKPPMASTTSSPTIIDDSGNISAKNIQDINSLQPVIYMGASFGSSRKDCNIGGARTSGTLYIIDGVPVDSVNAAKTKHKKKKSHKK